MLHQEYDNLKASNFRDKEKERVRKLVLAESTAEFSDEQFRLEYSLGQDYIYEPSSLVKIEVIEKPVLGFDMDEIGVTVSEGKEIQNQAVHSIEEIQLKKNSDILVDVRKIVTFIILRKLGVEPEWQDELATPNVFGPDSRYELGSGVASTASPRFVSCMSIQPRRSYYLYHAISPSPVSIDSICTYWRRCEQFYRISVYLNSIY